jgi:hypothetical protein
MNYVAGIAAACAAFATAVYLFLGYRLALRPVTPGLRLPAYQFSLFWIGLGAATLCGAILSGVAVYTLVPVYLAIFMLHTEILLICFALWGLLGYLTFLYTGKGYLWFWSVFYGALFIALGLLITADHGTSVVVTNGTVSVSFAYAVAGPLLDLLLVALIVPEFVGALLYFTLAFRTSNRTVRFRVTLVSWSLILWLGLTSLVAEVGAGGLAVHLALQLIGALAAVAILLAYYPPRWLRVRLRVTGVEVTPVQPTGEWASRDGAAAVGRAPEQRG